MKILLISSNSSSAGGGEQYLVYLAKGLKELGQEVQVLLSKRYYMNAWEHRLQDCGIKVRRENLMGLRERPLRFFESAFDFINMERVKKVCREIMPSIIHINQQYDADGLDYIIGAQKSGVAPVVGTIHMPMTLVKHPRDFRNIRTLIIKILLVDLLKRKFLKHFYKTNIYSKIFESNSMQREFELVYGCHGRQLTIYNGAGVSIARESKTAGKTIGFCGRLDPQKNLFLLVDSWLLTKEANSRPKLLIIGDGILRDKLQRYLQAKAPEGDWRITGWMENPISYIKNVDLLVFTSLFEGVSFAAVEAISVGVPVLSVKIPSFEELACKSQLVTVVDSKNPKEIGQRIRQILDKGPSEDQNNRDFFSYLRMARQTLDVYEQEVKSFGR